MNAEEHTFSESDKRRGHSRSIAVAVIDYARVTGLRPTRRASSRHFQ
jgi:hypothetical protein